MLFYHRSVLKQGKSGSWGWRIALWSSGQQRRGEASKGVWEGSRGPCVRADWHSNQDAHSLMTGAYVLNILVDTWDLTPQPDPQKFSHNVLHKHVSWFDPDAVSATFLSYPLSQTVPVPGSPLVMSEGLIAFCLSCWMSMSILLPLKHTFFPSFVRYFPAYLGLCKIYSQPLFFAVWMSSVCVHSCIWLFITPWTVVCKIPLSEDLSRKKILEWVVISFSMESSPPRDQTHVSCVSFEGGFFTTSATWEAQIVLHISRQGLHPWINTGRNSHCKLTQVLDQPSRLKAKSLKTIKKWTAALTWQNYLLK